MAFMMPVIKNDWDIYNTRSRKTSDNEKAGVGRMRKVSESRSEAPALGPRPALAPHRSAPAMRSLSYCRSSAPPPARSSRASLRLDNHSKGSASAATPPKEDKFQNRFVDKLKRAFSREPRRDERSS